MYRTNGHFWWTYLNTLKIGLNWNESNVSETITNRHLATTKPCLCQVAIKPCHCPVAMNQCHCLVAMDTVKFDLQSQVIIKIQAAASQSSGGGPAYRSTGMNSTSRWPGAPVQVTTFNNQQSRWVNKCNKSATQLKLTRSWPGENDHPERKVFSYENQSQQSRYGNAGASRRWSFFKCS